MKKSVPKGDKKKKKDVADEIAKLEKELEDIHTAELGQFKDDDTDLCQISSNDQKELLGTGDESEAIPQEISVQNGPLKLSKAQKRRNKKEAEAKEREKRISDQAEKNKEGPRFMEMSSIKKALREINLQIYNIPADGNCLYLAVKHQLEVLGMQTYTVSELRKRTANFMRLNKNDFMPFMYNEDDDSEIITEEAFDNYCKEVEKTKLWGGQLELKALSNILSCPIKIIQASCPPTIQGEHFKGAELILTYHRHLYRLGEHYNSTLPLVEDDST